MDNLNFVFWGTDEFAVNFLQGLKARELIPTLIVTTPDKPKGRKMLLTPPPVKVWAESNNIPVLQPVFLKNFEFDSPACAGRSFDIRNSSLFVVASYGKIIPKTILELPKYGTLNIHVSLLPKYRGATPMESVLLSGDKETGVTIIKLDEQVDHGPIIAQEKISLEAWQPNYEELRDKTAKIGAELFAKIIPDWITGRITAEEQDHSQATFTQKIEKEEGLIDLNGDPEMNYRKIRALSSWPGTYFFVNKNGRDLRVVIKKAHLENSELKIDRVIPEGKNEMDWESFRRGYLK